MTRSTSHPAALDALPSTLYLAAAVREIDQTAITRFGMPGLTLMHRAAAGSLRYLRQRWPLARQVLVVCGTGNNAGDGYLVALKARQAGLSASVVAVASPSSLTGDARSAYEEAVAGEVPVDEYKGEDLVAAAGSVAEAPDLVVDAVFGTGLNRHVTEFEVLGAKLRHRVLDIDHGLHLVHTGFDDATASEV